MRANEVEKAEHFKGFDWCLSVRNAHVYSATHIYMYNIICIAWLYSHFISIHFNVRKSIT